MKEVEIFEGEKLMVSDSLVENVDLSDFYENTITSGYFLEVSQEENKSIFSLEEVKYCSKSKSYTFEIISESGSIGCFLSSDKIQNIKIKRSGKRIFSIDIDKIDSLSYSASLTGNSSSITVILDLV